MTRMLSMGGYLTSRRPISLARQSVREQHAFTDILATVGCLEADIALGIPSIRRVTIGLLTLGVWGLAPTLRSRVESGDVEPIEWGATTCLRSLQAGARQEYVARGRFRPPFYGAPLDEAGLASTQSLREVKATRPDVAHIHVPYADPETGYAWGYGVGYDMILASAARRIVVSYDVATKSPPNLPNRFVIPRNLRAELVHRPFGAFPTGCFPLYGPCAPFYPHYLRRFSERPDAWAGSDICGQEDREFIHAVASAEDLDVTIGFGAAPVAEVSNHRKELMSWLSN